MATVTFTLDGTTQTYTDRTGITHNITQNETFALTFTDTGDGGTYVGNGSNTTLACDDGFRLNIEADPAFTAFEISADGAVNNPGFITFVEDGGTRVRWKVKSVNFTDADATGANNLASIVLEQEHNPMITMTLTNVNMA